jgi:archaemetzincin
MLFHRLRLIAAVAVLVAAALLLRGWLVTLADDAKGSFTPPNESARLSAIGSTQSLDRTLQRALQPAGFFAPIPPPGSSDWLANHREDGQTFEQFARGTANRPDQTRSKLYLQPLGVFDPAHSPDLKQVQAFAEHFFQLDVQVLPQVELAGLPIKSRVRDSGLRQLLSTDVLRWCEGRLPPDAYCLLAVTMEDLYPDERWNFVFGQASLNKRVGVYSFARYVPGFYGDSAGDDDASLILRRSCKVLAHETGHMFGIKHCIYFHCLMNGSNHLGESDQHPLHLCPVCLRKLQSSVGFEVAQRYQVLQEFSQQAGWDDEADWLRRRLAVLKR